MTTTRFSVRSIIEPSEPKASRPVARTSGQQLVGAVLHERHLAGGDPIEGRLVRVVDADAQAGIGEGEAQGKADVTAAAEDDDVEVRGAVRSWLRLYQPGAGGTAPEGPGSVLVLQCATKALALPIRRRP